MRGRVGSLNASVAGSILLFEAVAQRGGSDAPPADEPPRRRGGRRAAARRRARRAAARRRARRAAARRQRRPTSRRTRLLSPRRPSADRRRPNPIRWRTCCPKCRRSARGGPRRSRTPDQHAQTDRRRARPKVGAVARVSRCALPSCVAADVAQLVEQRFCKPPVPGSSPVVGSNNRGCCAPNVHHGGTPVHEERAVHLGRLSRW